MPQSAGYGSGLSDPSTPSLNHKGDRHYQEDDSDDDNYDPPPREGLIPTDALSTNLVEGHRNTSYEGFNISGMRRMNYSA